MEKNKPLVQNAIRLEQFLVVSVDYHFDVAKSNKNTDENIDDHDINIKAGIEFGYGEEDSKMYTVNFDFDLIAQGDALEMNLKAVGIFSTKDEITDEFKDSVFVKRSSPAMVFPYIRSYITTLTANSGVHPIILPALNFSAMTKEKKKAQ